MLVLSLSGSVIWVRSAGQVDGGVILNLGTEILASHTNWDEQWCNIQHEWYDGQEKTWGREIEVMSEFILEKTPLTWFHSLLDKRRKDKKYKTRPGQSQTERNTSYVVKTLSMQNQGQTKWKVFLLNKLCTTHFRNFIFILFYFQTCLNTSLIYVVLRLRLIQVNIVIIIRLKYIILKKIR